MFGNNKTNKIKQKKDITKKILIKNKNTDVMININDKETTKSDKAILDDGMLSLKDYIAPSAFDRSAPDYIRVGQKYVRAFLMEGFPRQVYIGWLNDIFNYDGDMDTAIYAEPTDDRLALDELTNKITQYEAQLQIDREKGNIRHITELQDKVDCLYIERAKLERNTEKLFHCQIFSTLYSNSIEQLNKETQKFDNRLRGRKIFMVPTIFRQDEAYKSVLPYGKSYINKQYRNFNSEGLTACFPFYNGDICHENGIYCAINMDTFLPIMIDFYDDKKLRNPNITCIGQSGTGKTFFVSLLTMRSALRGIRTVIIDPENEYKKLTEALNGSYIELSTNSTTHINPFDIEEEEILDDDNMPTGEKVVRVKEKVADILNLIGVMNQGLTGNQMSKTQEILQDLYRNKYKIDENPKSLYLSEPVFDANTGILYHDGCKKKMPTLGEFHDMLLKYLEHNNDDKEMKELAGLLTMYKKGGIYDLFDHETSEDLANFKEAPIITFDVSQLEENILRPIGMYVALNFTWEKFVKKNPFIKKRVICDEAWMMVAKTMKGSEYSADFLNKASRRIRKRNAGLLVASQKFGEFAESDAGRAILTNAIVKIFFAQDSNDIDALQDTFKLSDGEKMFLMQARRGEMLLRIQTESCKAKVQAFDFEKKYIEKKKNADNLNNN